MASGDGATRLSLHVRIPTTEHTLWGSAGKELSVDVIQQKDTQNVHQVSIIPDLDEESSSVFASLFAPFYSIAKAAQNFLGFHKLYNLPLWIIFGGALAGFCISRMPDYNRSFLINSIGVENWYWYRNEPYRLALYLHLATALPAGLLAPLQFIPAIRIKKIIVHRTIGYFCLFMVFVASMGGFILSRRVPSEDPAGILYAIALGAISLFSLFMAWINIVRLQIDQHRKAWVVLGSVISMRLIRLATQRCIDRVGSYSITYSCDNALFIIGGNSTLLGKLFPACLTAPDPHSYFVAVTANSKSGGILGHVATLRLSYALSSWLSLILHIILVEVYIHLTAAESERLRIYSYQRQLAKGYKRPGSSGFTADRLGDAKWTPPATIMPSNV
ncbi:uncharacterized protein EI90DRAFT_271600 [Cantharellus anzutake]|uniref:uncharacterized protein n=1 Tax=Cantharellus anzutake TaxID=1750568 RepID=UPI0019072C69|nr:uncharacterized protein EI90DRAFT_271600 [Cantharellus anzutake]KAF8335891.1 hypothetical protein EI90DRAFT_271600 [Cantharellus anzutake]